MKLKTLIAISVLTISLVIFLEIFGRYIFSQVTASDLGSYALEMGGSNLTNLHAFSDEYALRIK